MRPLAQSVLVALVGCSGRSDRVPPSPTTPVEPTALVLVDSTHSLESLAREPMVAVHPTGALFVSGYGLPGPKLWKSGDGGATWQRVAVGTEAEGAIGNSDVDLAVGPDSTVYFVTMGYDRKKFEGTHVVIGVSHDVGASWKWTRLSTTRFDDRPWVEVARDGTAHVIWNDGKGVCHAVSTDRGATWTERARINDQGGSSHLAVGPKGEVAVRIAPLAASGNKFDRGVDLIAVSADGGSTWVKRPAPGERQWGFPIANPKDLPRWVEPLAWDAAGVLYSFWSEGSRLRLGRSVDQGATWETTTVAEGGPDLYFPYLIARAQGDLAASWLSGHGDSLRANVASIAWPPGTGQPRVLRPPPFTFESWQGLEKSAAPAARDPAGEYLALAFLDHDQIGVVSPIQHAAADRFGFSWWRFERR